MSSTSAYQEFTGKSVEEALRLAREAFGVGLDDLDFEILSPGSRGVLGMGAEPARVLAAPRSELGGAAPKREAAAASRFGAAPPSSERGAARMRAGSAPMPSTPRLPGVRISKSRSSSPTPKASRARRRASSTDLPVNSW